MNLCLKKCLTEKKIRLEMKRSPRNMMTWKKVAVYDVIVHFLILAGIEPPRPWFLTDCNGVCYFVFISCYMNTEKRTQKS